MKATKPVFIKAAKILYLGGADYIGAKVTKYPNGSYKLDQITGKTI